MVSTSGGVQREETKRLIFGGERAAAVVFASRLARIRRISWSCAWSACL